MKSTISNAGDAIGNRHRGQTAATIESIISNAYDISSYSINGDLIPKYVFNIVTIRIRFTHYGIRIYRHRGQTGAAPKSILSNACDTIRNSYRS